MKQIRINVPLHFWRRSVVWGPTCTVLRLAGLISTRIRCLASVHHLAWAFDHFLRFERLFISGTAFLRTRCRDAAVDLRRLVTDLRRSAGRRRGSQSRSLTTYLYDHACAAAPRFPFTNGSACWQQILGDAYTDGAWYNPSIWAVTNVTVGGSSISFDRDHWGVIGVHGIGCGRAEDRCGRGDALVAGEDCFSSCCVGEPQGLDLLRAAVAPSATRAFTLAADTSQPGEFCR